MEGEGFLFAVGEEMDLAGESVGVGVETRALRAGFAFGGGRAGGFVGKFGFVPGYGVGDRMLYVKTHFGYSSIHRRARRNRDTRKDGWHEVEGKGQLYFGSA